MARENFANLFDKLAFLAGDLGLCLLLQIVVAIAGVSGNFRADDQVLDLNLALRLLVAALNDDTRRIAPVGILELDAEIVLWIAEIELGADARPIRP